MEPVVRPFNVSLLTLVLVVLVWQGLLVLHGQMFLVSLHHSLFKVEEEEEAGNGGYQGTNEFNYSLFLSSSGILYSSSAIPH